MANKRLKTLEGPVKLVCARRRREPLRIPTISTHARRSERMFRVGSDDDDNNHMLKSTIRLVKEA